MLKRFITKTSNIVKLSKSLINQPRGEHRPKQFSSHLLRIMKIGTHDGVFHCDEVLACYMLKLLPEYKDAEIVRTRNMDILNTMDIVVDVGAVFDHQTKRYDHHQREFTETLSSLRPELGDKYKIKLSSAGLVYTYYGEKVIQQLSPKDNPLTRDNLTIVYKKVYENFIEEVDAIDNGVPIADTTPKYKITTNLSARVGKLNPEWNSKQTINIDKLFQQAMALVGAEFADVVNYLIQAWLPARDYVKNAIEARFEVHESGEILEFTERFPWKEHLFDLEKEMDLVGKIKFVLFMDKPESWRVQSVPLSPNSFLTRKPLHPDWWGVRDELLSDVAGIPHCVFCHATGFIGGNRTRAGALRMAVASLTAPAHATANVNEEVAKANEDVAKASDDVLRTAEKVAKANEDVAKASEDVVKAIENVVKANEDVAKANEDVVKATKEVAIEVKRALEADTVCKA